MAEYWHVSVNQVEVHRNQHFGGTALWLDGFLAGAGFDAQLKREMMEAIFAGATLDYVYSFELDGGKRFVEVSKILIKEN